MKDIELLQSYGKPLQRNEMQLAYVQSLLGCLLRRILKLTVVFFLLVAAE